MSSFKDLTASVAVAPQLSAQDVEIAAKEGFVTLICNRPDGEEPGQPLIADTKAAAEAQGMQFVYAPIISGQVTADAVAAFASALSEAAGPVLAYCRSGTRSATLWALAEAQRGGHSTDEILQACASQGYQLDHLRPTLDQLRPA